MSPILEILGAHSEGKHFYNFPPEIDSIWKAKDGRKVRICKITYTAHIKGGWWADIFVLPPYKYRQKRKTTAGAESFSSGFYKLEVS